MVDSSALPGRNWVFVNFQMSSGRFGRPVCGVVLAAALLIGPAAAQAAPGDQQAPQKPVVANWAVTLNRATLYSGPSDTAVAFGDIPADVTLQILGYQADWAHVYNPRSRAVAWTPSDQLGPSDPPSRYVTMPPPALVDDFQTRGVVTDEAPLAVYPTTADEAAERQIDPNTWLNLTGAVTGEDGSLWYRTGEDDYVPADSVFVPERTEDFSGHWLDVDLNTPAHVTAYDGDTEVDSFLTIKGAGPRPTPTGTFTILRRVANETMNSDTIGIPRFGPGGYYLTGVLFTQYFTDDGASLHYNYWSSNWGYPGSHGCLGLNYANSSWLWGWSKIGTPVSIHY
jgi:L,D-transpeptidase catalytic domain